MIDMIDIENPPSPGPSASIGSGSPLAPAVPLGQGEAPPPIEPVTAEIHVRELQTRVQDLEGFAGTVAHDLKNPLTAVRGAAEILISMDGDLTPEERHGLLIMIDSRARKIEHMINTYLVLAVSGQESIPMQPLDMNGIAAGVLAGLKKDIDEQHAAITLSSGLPPVRGNDVLVESIFTNLLSNTLKYGHAGGKPPNIGIAAEPSEDGKYVKFTVKDHGPGIKPEDRGKIFERLQRGSDTGGQKGYGIGLSNVRKFVELMGGTIGVEDTEGGGCTFFFTLPKT